MLFIPKASSVTLSHMQLLRLRGRKICERVQRQGLLWKGKNLMIRYIPGAPRHPSVDPETPALYVGAVASTKLDKSAVRRNRMRRRCREALRVAVQTTPNIAPVQLLIIPRSSSLEAPFGDIQEDIARFLSIFHGSHLKNE